MGKRKRDSDHTRTDGGRRFCTASENVPHSHEMEHFSGKALQSLDPGDVRPVLDITDRSKKVVNAHTSAARHHHHQNLGRSMFLKHSRHHCGHQYSRRHSAHRANTSSSHAKSAYCDDKVSFKFASQSNSYTGRFSEYSDKAFYRPERIHSRCSVLDLISPDATKMVCGLCERLLSRKLHFLGNSLSPSNELSVVAVLVCGHAYHADCLEQRTNPEQRWDPPCPSCSGLVSQINDSSAQ